MSDMTLAEAAEILDGEGWACACSGVFPGSGGLCGCQWMVARARGLRRAAHIAVKQVAGLASLRSEQLRTNACAATRPNTAPCRAEIGHDGSHTWERWC